MRSTKTRASRFLDFLATRRVVFLSTYNNISLISAFLQQFGGQEPADDAGVAEFCTLNHGVTFPLMKKSEVNGDNTNEVYKWLKNEKAGLLGLTRIKVRHLVKYLIYAD